MPTHLPSRQADGLPQKRRFLGLLMALFAATSSADDLVAQSLLRLQQAAKTSQASAKPPVFDRAVFLKRATINDVQLSPDGRHLVFTKRDAEQTDLLLQSLSDNKTVVLLRDIKKSVIRWAADGKYLWINDELGLSTIDVVSHKAKRVYKWDKTLQARLFTIDPRASQYAVVQEKLTDSVNNRISYRYQLVNIHGQASVLAETSLPWRRVLLNEAGRVQVLSRFRDSSYKTVISVPRGSSWRDVAECEGYVQSCTPLMVSTDATQLWLETTTHDPRTGISQLSFANGQFTAVHRDPQSIADVYDVLLDQKQSSVMAVSYYTDKQHWYAIDKRVEADLNFLASQWPLADFSIARDQDDRHWLITVDDSQFQYRRYYLYSPIDKKLNALFESETTQQAISSAHLVQTVPLSYRASDGMLLHGFVYLPLGRDLKNVPLIAGPHGGPWSQGRGGYSTMVQMMVNRGYAVFTPNFRASEGYGLDYLLAAKADFAKGRVLQDTLDGMDYLLANGIGDNNKQAIAGHSFGGYTSLLAVSHFPDRFLVAIASAPPHDFAWVMKNHADNESEALRGNGAPFRRRFEQMGVPVNDVAWVKKMQIESPASNVAAVKTPVYVWAGEKDERVPIKGMTYYAALLKKQKKPVSFLLDPDSMHNPETPLSIEALIYFYELALSRHLNGPKPASPSADLAEFLKNNWRFDSNTTNTTAVSK